MNNIRRSVVVLFAVVGGLAPGQLFLPGAAEASKPLPGVEVSWSAPSSFEPGDVATADLRVLAHVPVLRVRIRVPDPQGMVLGPSPAYEGELPAGEPLIYSVIVRIPGEPQAGLVAVVEVESPAGSYEVSGLLPMTRPGRSGRRTTSTRTGEVLLEYPLTGVRAPAARPGSRGSQSPTLVLSGQFLYRDRAFGPSGFLYADVGDDPTKPIRYADVEILQNGLVIDGSFTDSTGVLGIQPHPLWCGDRLDPGSRVRY
jgi:hypothetical protein